MKARSQATVPAVSLRLSAEHVEFSNAVLKGRSLAALDFPEMAESGNVLTLLKVKRVEPLRASVAAYCRPCES